MSRTDWCISRQRAWGVPIPAFYDLEGEAVMTPQTISHIQQLVQKYGTDCWWTMDTEELLPPELKPRSLLLSLLLLPSKSNVLPKFEWASFQRIALSRVKTLWMFGLTVGSPGQQWVRWRRPKDPPLSQISILKVLTSIAAGFSLLSSPLVSFSFLSS